MYHSLYRKLYPRLLADRARGSCDAKDLGPSAKRSVADSERRRQDWSRSYLTSVLTRDLRDIAAVEKLTELPKFVRLLAEHSGQLVTIRSSAPASTTARTS